MIDKEVVGQGGRLVFLCCFLCCFLLCKQGISSHAQLGRIFRALNATAFQ